MNAYVLAIVADILRDFLEKSRYTCCRSSVGASDSKPIIITLYWLFVSQHLSNGQARGIVSRRDAGKDG
jgi:hypothetical protein